MANINEIVSKVSKMDPDLGRDLRRYVTDHAYGLVYERNLPDGVRLYTKKPALNDTVNILPPRGQAEKAENKRYWVVSSITDGIATITSGEETTTVSVDDIVPVVTYRDKIYPGLREVDRITRGAPNDPFHVVINSENYHALEILQYCYAGKVDCIYIDPPFNSRAKDWKYNNDYVDDNDKYKHSKWLTFMERRLKIAKTLLNSEDSVLICAIDEKECTRLGLLLEQMFPEAKIQMITDVINPSGIPTKNGFSRAEEYLYYVFIGDSSISLSYTDMLHVNKEPKAKKVRWASLLRSGNNSARSDRPNLYYPLFFDKNTGKLIKIGDSIGIKDDPNKVSVPDNCFVVWPKKNNNKDGTWQLKQSTLREKISKGYFKYGPWKPGKTKRTISYFSDGLEKAYENGEFETFGQNSDGSIITGQSNKKTIPLTVWNLSSHGAGDNGSSLLLQFFLEKRFTFPKSLYSTHDAINFVVANKPNALIVDFFAGSGTTLHATCLLNAEDGGHRKCICVTNNEVSFEEATTFISKGLRQGDKEWERYGIAKYVTWPRVKCAIEGHDINGEPLNGNYIGPNGKKDSGQPMSDGFKANAIFFDLTYESFFNIRLDMAFDAIAPIIWMQSGCQGDIIKKIAKGYSTTDRYGVLFNFAQVTKFCEAIKAKKTISDAYVVTDDQSRYSNVCRRLPGINVHRLYKSYIETFEILGEGGLD